ncbi:MAG: hypothetical protein COW75_05675 [Rhodobacterales bacterium CG18_big_fil_WC_8_21_14_2_50_71_9]|nr:MAG: hypothetical protein COW75_05675 [Rhodobacterales bacterium CG18_big_fil_WC_8_21_14_2_50_71_9]
MRRVALWLVALLLAAAVAGAAYVRLAPDDPAAWHVDPLSDARTGRPNEARILPQGGAADAVVSPVFAMTPEALMRRFDAAAMADARVTRLAGGTEALFATYVQRSAMFGWPDYISVRAVAVEGGAALAVWSRSRYGYSDMGVNRARVGRWLAATSG